jgi:hypothetical protein
LPGRDATWTIHAEQARAAGAKAGRTKVSGIDPRQLCDLPAETPGTAKREKFVKKLEEKLLVARGFAPHTSVGRETAGHLPDG